MKNVTSNPKTCAACGQEYQPTSNRQTRCKVCGKKRELELRRLNHKEKYKRKGYSQSGRNNNAFKTGQGCYRKMALEHYGETCMDCGATKNICVHHKHGNRKNDNELENLEVICRSCHAKKHNLAANFNR